MNNNNKERKSDLKHGKIKNYYIAKPGQIVSKVLGI